MKDRFLGPHKIIGAAMMEYKTPQGNDILKIMYDAPNLPPEIIPVAVFERLVTEVPIDYTTLRDKRYTLLLEELAGVCLEHDIKFGDLNYVGKKLMNNLQDSYERASNFLWTGDDKQWISGISFLSDRTLLETEQILKKIKPQNEPEKPTKPAEPTDGIATTV